MQWDGKTKGNLFMDTPKTDSLMGIGGDRPRDGGEIAGEEDN